MFKRLDSTDNLSIQVDDEVLAILNTNIANQFSNIRVLYEGVIWSTIMKKYSPKLENILFCGKIDYSHIKQMEIKIVDLIKNIELIKSLRTLKEMIITIPWEDPIINKIGTIQEEMNKLTEWLHLKFYHEITAKDQITNVQQFIEKVPENNVMHVFDFDTYLRISELPLTKQQLNEVSQRLIDSKEDDNHIFDNLIPGKQTMVRKALKYADKKMNWKSYDFSDILPQSLTICGFCQHENLDLRTFESVTHISYDVHSVSSSTTIHLPPNLKTMKITQTFPKLLDIPQSLEVLELGESPTRRPKAEKRRLKLENEDLRTIEKMNLKTFKLNNVETIGKIVMNELDELELICLNMMFTVECNSLKKLTYYESEAIVIVKENSHISELTSDLNHVRLAVTNLNKVELLKIVQCQLDLLCLDYFDSEAIFLKNVDAMNVVLRKDNVKYLTIDGCQKIDNTGLPALSELSALKYHSIEGCEQLSALSPEPTKKKGKK